MGIKHRLITHFGKDELYISCFEIGHVRYIYINISNMAPRLSGQTSILVLSSLYPWNLPF